MPSSSASSSSAATEPAWIDVLAQSGALFLAVGIAQELAARKSGEAAYRTAVGIAVVTVLLLGWINAAVGIIGSENDNANLMYAGVVLVGMVGAVIAPLRPEGMARALFATAIAQALVALIAIAGGLGAPYSGPFEPFAANGVSIALFVASAVLFGRAARGRVEDS